MSRARRRAQSRIGSNIAWNFAAGFASIFGLILLYPLSVAASGAEAYGIWVLAFAAIQLFTQADFGLGTGVVRTLSRIEPDNLRHQERQYFVTVSHSAFVLLAVLLTATFSVAFPAYLSTVRMSQELINVAPFIVSISAASLFIAVLGRSANAVLWAEDRPDIERKASLVSLVFRALGLIVVLTTGQGIIGVVIVEAASVALPSLVCAAAVLIRYGRPRFSARSYRAHLKPLLRVSGVLFIGTFAAVAAVQLPLYIVGGSFGLSAATAFGALLRVFQSAKLAVSWLTNPFTHAIVSPASTSQTARAAAAKCLKLTCGAATLIAVPLAVLPNQILEVWLGGDFVFAGSSLSLLALAVLANGIILPSALVTTLRSNPWPVAVMNLIVLVLTGTGVAVGVHMESMYLATAGMVLPLVLIAPAFFILARKALDLRIAVYGRWSYMFGVMTLVLVASAFVFANAMDSLSALLCYGAVAASFLAFGILVSKSLGTAT